MREYVLMWWAMDEGKKRRGRCRRADAAYVLPRGIATHQKITTVACNPLSLKGTRKQRGAGRHVRTDQCCD